MKIRWVSILALLVLSARPAVAQSNPDKHVDFAVFLQGGALNFDAKRFFCCVVAGAEFPLTIKGRELGLVAEAGFHYAPKEATAGGLMTSYFGGVKKRLTAIPSVNTFVQGMVGVQNYFGTNVAVQVGAGVDLRFKGRNFLRFQGDVRAVASLTGVRLGFRGLFGVVVPLVGQ